MMSHKRESLGLLVSNDSKGPGLNNDGHLTNNDAKSSNQPMPMSQTVKEAVAIAAGKKESGNDDDDGKNIKSNMLCYLYWLLVVLILGLISFTIWLSIQLARRHNEMSAIGFRNSDHRRRFDFEDIFNSSFQIRSLSAEWVADSDTFLYRPSNVESLILFNATDKTSAKILDSSIFSEHKVHTYTSSHDLRYILLESHPKKVWKYSFTAKYVLYDRKFKPGVSQIHYLGQELNEDGKNGLELQYAQLAPSSNSIAFLYKNNLYIKRGPQHKPVQVTMSGSAEKEVYNGLADWTYEKVLKRTNLFWWSPNSKHLVYLSLNSSQVDKFFFQKKYTGKQEDLVSFPFPKANSPGKIPEVEVKILNVNSNDNNHKVLPKPVEFQKKECYVSQVFWKDSRHVVVVWLNRPQNQSITTMYNIDNPVPNNIHQQLSTNGWVESLPQIVFTEERNSFFTILPMKQQDSTLWNHLALVTATKEEMRENAVRFLTKGYEEILSIAAYNEKKHEVYYISTNKDPKKRHLFKLNLKTEKSRCITCEQTPTCHWVEVVFSQSTDYFIESCLGPDVPYYVLRSTNSSYNKVLEDNRILKSALSNKILPERKFIEISIREKTKVWVEIILPQEEGSKKFPLLLQASGEPGTQSVTYKFKLGWETFMASFEEVAVARVDVAGSGGRGVTFKHRIHNQMTFVDVDDLQLVGLHLKEFDLVDPAKVAVWGWGHSGLLALHALANETDIYPCGLIGGVTASNKYFDAPTYERYYANSNEDLMHQKSFKNNLIEKTGLLKNKKLALVQGLNDDHVKHASSMGLLDSLADFDIILRYRTFSDLDNEKLALHRNLLHFATQFLAQDCYTFFWKHDTKTWIVDKTVKKEKFRIKQFCV